MSALATARRRRLAGLISLRAYLTVKARAGLFDDRMCAYYGCPVPTLRSVRQAIRRGYLEGLVPTFTTNGVHSAGSFHKSGHAVDLGLRREDLKPHGGGPTEAGLRKLTTHQRREHWRRRHGKLPTMVELIGPTNELVVLRGRETDLREGDPLETMHDNHVHEAFAS